MALYIHPENQTVIWTALCGTPMFAAWDAPIGEKTRVFREKVGGVYDDRAKFQSDPTRLSARELGRMNRAAMAGIAAYIQGQPLRNAPPGQIRRSPGPANPAAPSTGETIMRDFDGRAREYDTMRSPPAPTDIQFANDVAEGPIENIDELVQRCLRERDADLHAHAAPTLDPRAPDAILSGVVSLDDPSRRAGGPAAGGAAGAGMSVRWSEKEPAEMPPTDGVLEGADARARMDALSEQMARLSQEISAAAAISAARHAEITEAISSMQARSDGRAAEEGGQMRLGSALNSSNTIADEIRILDLF